MIKRPYPQISLLMVLVMLLLAVLGCSLTERLVEAEQAVPSPEPTTAPADPDPTDAPTEMSPSTEFPPPTEAAYPEPEAAEPSPTSPDEQTASAALAGLGPCETESCVVDGFFPFLRPIGEDGRQEIDATNSYATYRRVTKDSYHGVFFLNASGTPAIAAADGTVVVAGNDIRTPYGPIQNLYGKLVIVEHQLPWFDQPIYTLYGHLSGVGVVVGEEVVAGEKIGRVGNTGVIKGSTLYFEIRFGENEYRAVRNPSLWVQPLEEDGELQSALAGRILDAEGKYVRMDNLVLERLDDRNQRNIYLGTYHERRLIGNDPWQENFAAVDLPPGDYQISFWLDGIHEYEFTLEPGKLTLVTFRLE